MFPRQSMKNLSNSVDSREFYLAVSFDKISGS